MQLSELLNSVRVIQVTGEIQRQDVSGIFYDSRKVIKNSIFVAIKGFKTDGHKYILEAINRGAIAIILEDEKAVPDEIFQHSKSAKILVASSRIALAEISNAFFKFPSQHLNVIGITGTNGKTTTSYFIKNVLESAGYKVGLIGTIANYIGRDEIPSSLTTPESSDLNELFFTMKESSCSHVVMEVSSHSLSLQRVSGIQFSAGIFTNITSDHLDFHSTFENYLSAKKILFNSLPESALLLYNSNDPNSYKIIADSKAKKYSYGAAEDAEFIISNIDYDLNGTNLSIKYNGIRHDAATILIGEFNAYNAAASFALGVLMGLEPKVVLTGIKTTKQVPGRFEVIGRGDKKVVIDYSHTADSLEKALLSLRKIVKGERPIHTVFGCGGNRDRTKRAVMGKIASELSLKTIVTSDNPRFEEPFEIINEITAGIKKNNFSVIENREEAIKEAVKNSEPNAVILIAGKGHEPYQEIGGLRYHFSDKEIAEKYLYE